MSQRERMRQRSGADPALGHSIKGQAPAAPPSVQLRIDQLVLAGVAPGERERVADAVRDELARLLAAPGAAAKFAAPVNREQLDGGTIRIAGAMRAVSFGEQIAQAVHGSLGTTNMAERGQRS